MTEYDNDNLERQLQGLLAYPREALDIELKGWLDLTLEEDRANLAKGILALANHGGGYILLGFAEMSGDWRPSEARPADLSLYSQDAINGIVHRYAEPIFHCAMYHVAHPVTGTLFPIIRVPGGHRVPIRSKSDDPDKRHVRCNIYYIRRPGPTSEAPRTGQEWDELISRCVKANREDLIGSINNLLQGIGQAKIAAPEEQAREILDLWIDESATRLQSLIDEKLPDEKPSRYTTGTWSVGYIIGGDFKPQPLNAFLKLLEKVTGRETGWPAWWIPTREEIRPYPYNGIIECWMKDTTFRDSAHSDFWRASPKGMMFLLRGYDEDSAPERYELGKRLDLTLPMWRIGECLLHAQRLATELVNPSASVMFRANWRGLQGRRLVSWANPVHSISARRPSEHDSVTSELFIKAEQITTSLAEIVYSLTMPLYEIFDFYSPPMRIVNDEVSRLQDSSV